MLNDSHDDKSVRASINGRPTVKVDASIQLVRIDHSSLIANNVLVLSALYGNSYYLHFFIEGRFSPRASCCGSQEQATITSVTTKSNLIKIGATPVAGATDSHGSTVTF